MVEKITKEEILGTDINQVYATVIPPNFNPEIEFKNWNDLTFAEFDLAKIPAKLFWEVKNFLQPLSK